jgi:hypothetical protein
MQLLGATLAYPALLLVLSLGGGLLVDRIAGRFLPGALLLTVGFALLVCASQLSTWSSVTARATPYVLVAIALVGLALSLPLLRALVVRLRVHPWPAVAALAAYAVAIAPVVLAGRTTLTGYLLDTTSATHLAGADFLLHHGRDFGGLDPNTSYGMYLKGYFGTGYPSGGHTALAGTGALVPVDLVWLYQPYMAFLLALNVGPLTVLLRRVGLSGLWAAVGALTCAVPALVYAYDLVGSIKEITALPMILTVGALVACHRLWFPWPPRRAVPFGVVAGAGLTAVGVSFGAWLVAAVLVLLGVAVTGLRARRVGWRGLLGTAALGAGVGLVCALPVVVDARDSFNSARGIARTTDPGNLLEPLRPLQAFGVWLGGSYRVLPSEHLLLTYGLIGVMAVAAVLGLLELGRTRRWALLAWLLLLGLVWWQLTARGTTWTDAKLILLFSSALVLATWAGVAALRRGGRRLEAALLAVAITGGILYSDALQYHDTSLAPTARFNELREIGREYAGRGPTLMPDFDEYALYFLRDMGVSSPGFAFKPAALGQARIPYGFPADLDQLSPSASAGTRLIVMRRNPTASRPPSNFTLIKTTRWYQVWERRDGAPSVRARLPLGKGLQAGKRPKCGDVRRLARVARGGALVVARRPPTLVVQADRAMHSPGWMPLGGGPLFLATPGRLEHSYDVPVSGRWTLWIQGQIGRRLTVRVDGAKIATIQPQTAGLGNVAAPIALDLERGRHRVEIVRGGGSLAPGNGALTELNAVILTTGTGEQAGKLTEISPRRYWEACAAPADWIEAVA